MSAGNSLPPVRALPDRPDLGQLRRQAKELHRAAAAGDSDALARLAAVSQSVSLHGAQLALAREYGFASWARLKAEVERLRMIRTGDVDGLAALVAGNPALAVEPATMPDGTTVPLLAHVGGGLLHGWWTHHRAGDLTRVLTRAGLPVEAEPGKGAEPPLVTAASMGEPDMVRALIDAGADLEARGFAAPGSATALAHAVHYGIVEAVDLLVAAGAVIHDVVEAAGVGDISEFRKATVPPGDLILALRAASVCERLRVIDELIDLGVDVNAEFRTLTEPGGATALHCAAWEGKDRSVAHLLDRGADPNHLVHGGDPPRPSTPLDWCRSRAGVGHGGNHAAVEALLVPVTEQAT